MDVQCFLVGLSYGDAVLELHVPGGVQVFVSRNIVLVNLLKSLMRANDVIN